MTRTRARDRLEPLIETATDLFIHKGYRRTQMADVTTAMGLSPGAVYRYVESKEALFDLVVRAAISPDQAPAPPTLPVPTPEPGGTAALVRQVIARAARLPALEAALSQTACPDPRAELTAVVRELYTLMSRYRCGIKLSERCALDWPELAAIWFDTARTGTPGQLAAYLEQRIAQGYFRPVPHVPTSARLFMEIVTIFAVHIHWDPYPVPIRDADLEAAVVDNLVHAHIAG